MNEIKGRLGLETARVPQKDRHGLLWLGRGHLYVKMGTLKFICAGNVDLPAGHYDIPFQLVSCIVLQPGTSITHDVLRLCSNHGTGVIIVGECGTRLFSFSSFGPNESARARKQAEIWANEDLRINMAKQMYYLRFNEVFENNSLNELRGIEGARMKTIYKNLASQYNIQWNGRFYDRNKPELTDNINMAINHAVTAVEGAAMVAVAVTGAIPQLGFIHETPGHAFTLDITDLYRDTVTLPMAFKSINEINKKENLSLEQIVRKNVAKKLHDSKIISNMIDKIKNFLD